MRIRSPIRAGTCVLMLMASIAGAALAYEPDEIKAIVDAPRRPPAPEVERVVLASQRMLAIDGKGAMTTQDHRLLLVGPGALRPFEERWSFQPDHERFGLAVGRIHHPDGRIEEIPADSVRIVPHGAAGPAGYPGLADCIVHAAVAAGDIVEIRTVCESKGAGDPTMVCGEHCFADADSVVESEFNLAFPASLAMLVWDFGGLPGASRSVAGSDTRFRWLTGHLPALRPVTRIASSAIGGVLPDSLSPPTILYGFQMDWRSIVAARSRAWSTALERSPPELVDQTQRILEAIADPRERRDEALRWFRERFRDLQLPATRYRFHPLDPAVILGRQEAVPCDRAMILVWLLRHVGIAADAVTVRSRPGGDAGAPMPQQFDLWVVRSRIGAGEPVWIDLRDDAEGGRPIPSGSGLVWTSDESQDPLVGFPGIAR